MLPVTPNVHKQTLLIIGAGMAAMRLVDTLLASNCCPYRIVLIQEEACEPYNRILLSSVLAGEKSFEQVQLHAPQWFMQQGVQVLQGKKALTIHNTPPQVVLDDGQCISFDHLVIATGSLPFMPNLEGIAHPRVIGFRTKNDVDHMLQLPPHSHVVVLGAGLLGLEAAYGLSKQGHRVTVVHQAGHVLNRQLDAQAGQLLQQTLEQHGIQFELNAQSERVLWKDAQHLDGLQLRDGRTLQADLMVVTIGVRPNIALAQASGLPVRHGVLVSSQLRTAMPNVYALGECTEYESHTFGLVAPVYAQADVLAQVLLGQSTVHFALQPTATTLKVTGVHVYSVGDFSNADAEHVYWQDDRAGHYKHLVIQHNRLVGCVLYGDVADGAYYFDLITQQHNIQPIRHGLMFGRHGLPDLRCLAEVV